MSLLQVSYAGHLSDRVQDLYFGRTKVKGIELNYIPLSPLEAFRRISKGEFDTGEMSLSSYIIHRARGDERFIAIPVFPSRAFRHRAIYINRHSGVREPRDLIGRKVGVPEYQMTAAVWVRGLLLHEYGVEAKNLQWVTGGLREPGRSPLVNVHVPNVEIAPVRDRCLDDLLVSGEIDAIVAPQSPPSFDANHPDIGRLFPNYRDVESAYYEKTRLFPIMHTVVLQNSFYERFPWAAANLFHAFNEAKENCLRNLEAAEPLPVSLPWIDVEVDATRALFGKDIWPYGIEENREVIETACRYVEEQGLSRRVRIDELFAFNPGACK